VLDQLDVDVSTVALAAGGVLAGQDIDMGHVDPLAFGHGRGRQN
jgi:hypothetical protein